MLWMNERDKLAAKAFSVDAPVARQAAHINREISAKRFFFQEEVESLKNQSSKTSKALTEAMQKAVDDIITTFNHRQNEVFPLTREIGWHKARADTSKQHVCSLPIHNHRAERLNCGEKSGFIRSSTIYRSLLIGWRTLSRIRMKP